MLKRNLTFILIFITIMWGFSWVSSKYLAAHSTIYELTFWRFLISAIFVYASMLMLNERTIVPQSKSLLWLILGGVFMGLSQIVNFEGLAIGNAGYASILFNSLNPILTFIMAFLIFRRKISVVEFIALLLGFCGVAIIFRIWDAGNLLSTVNLLFVLNALLFALVSITSQKASLYTSAGIFALYMNIIAMLMILIFCDISVIFSFFNKDLYFWLNLIFMAGISGGFGTVAYFYVISKLGSATASGFIFLVPISSVIASAVFFDETVGVSSIVGGVMTFVGVYMLSCKKLKA